MLHKFMQEVYRKANDKVIEHESKRVAGSKSSGRTSFNELNELTYFEEENSSGITLYTPPCNSAKYVIADEKIKDFIVNDLTTLRLYSEFIIGIYIAIVATFFINNNLLPILSDVTIVIVFLQIFLIRHYSMNKVKLFFIEKYNHLKSYKKELPRNKPTINKKNKISIKNNNNRLIKK